MYTSDLPQWLSETGSYLCADDVYFLPKQRRLQNLRCSQHLDKKFSTFCKWFVDNRLSTHFGEDKTNFVLFSKTKCLSKLNISNEDHIPKQYHTVEYSGCHLDSNLSGKSMAMNVLKRVNAKVKFCYRHNQYLTPKLKKLLCNALIQPHFDYVCKSWFPLLN